MSRTDLDPTTLAASLRLMAGDGSVEWVCEPMQTRVLLDVADMLGENAKLRRERDTYCDLVDNMVHPDIPDQLAAENAKLRDENTRLLSCLTDDAENARQILGESRALRDENAKLREESGKYNDLYAHAIADAEVWHLQWSAEHQENAKLRELLRFIMHQCNDGNPRCDECIGWNDGECVALLRMRELEIEVPC